MKGKVQCTCGWSWNKSDSSKKDMYVCHECGRDNSNNMKNGGWLDSYADGGTMQEHQENYNDSQASAPEGVIGDGFSNVGRNYSPAWGGQFQMGGSVYPVNYVPEAQNGGLTFLQPTSDKLPEGYRIPYADPSSERAMSIGGEDGEPAYLIPTFKHGEPLNDPIEEFRKTGEHLGGPFKTWQEADKWEIETRHPAVEKGEKIMFPQEKFAMGGSIPGAVGFSYARTQGIPSNGPYAKKTMASAQTGVRLDMYGAPITAIEVNDPNTNRSGYDPRTNRMILGSDINDENRAKAIAHENRHAWQFANDRTNFNITHHPEYAFQDRLKKKPVGPVTTEVFEDYHDRKRKEIDVDVKRFKENNPEFSFIPNQMIYKEIVDHMQYNEPSSVEGEAQYYEDTGKQFKNGGWLDNYEEGGIINSDRGQWDHPGKITRIKGGNITMKPDPKTGKALTKPLLGIADTGEQQMMYPGEDYNFEGANYVTEYPKGKRPKKAKNGLRQEQKGLVNLDQLTNFTNYNTKQSGGWLDQY